MTKYILTLSLSLYLLPLFGQSAGENVWSFLNNPVTAHATSLGGQQISIYGDNLNFVYNNPSLLNSSMSNKLTLSYVDYLDDIKYGYVSYARTFEKYGNFGLGINHIDYGEFTEADEYGTILGTFDKVYDYNINVYYSRTILDSLLQVGGTIKAIGSQYQYWNAFGFAMDAAVTYHNPISLFTAAFVMKNLGSQVNTFYEGADYESLPFQIQFGITKKLQHAPFRFSILAEHLETPKLSYKTEDDNANAVDPISGEVLEDSGWSSFSNNLMRHMVFGLEFMPMKNFNFRLGYNYRRRTELAIPDKMGFSGFSWGFGLKVYKFYIDYGRARYHLAAVTNHFTLSINLDEFDKKF